MCGSIFWKGPHVLLHGFAINSVFHINENLDLYDLAKASWEFLKQWHTWTKEARFKKKKP